MSKLMITWHLDQSGLRNSFPVLKGARNDVIGDGAVCLVDGIGAKKRNAIRVYESRVRIRLGGPSYAFGLVGSDEPVSAICERVSRAFTQKPKERRFCTVETKALFSWELP
jgi:hypothetical protein